MKERITGLLRKIDGIMSSRLILTGFLMVQGIGFLLYPERAVSRALRSLALTLVIAAGLALSGFITERNKDRQSIRSITITVLLLIIGALTWYSANSLGNVFETILALVIIGTGVLNLFYTNRQFLLEEKRLKMEQSLAQRERDESLKEIRDAVTEDIKLQKDRLLQPLVFASKRLKRFRYGEIAIHLMFVAVGILMLFFRFSTNQVLMRGSGLLLVIYAAVDIAGAVRDIYAKRKVKESLPKE